MSPKTAGFAMAFALLNQGKSGREVEKILAQQKKRGIYPHARRTLQVHYKLWKEEGAHPEITTETLASALATYSLQQPPPDGGRGEKAQQATPDHEDVPTSKTPDSPSPALGLTDQEIELLKEVASWWTAQKAQKAPLPPATPFPAHRPIFAGHRHNSGVRVCKLLLDDALKKAKTPEELQQTGGNLSALLEFLLWQYLDFDRKYLGFGDPEI